MPNGVCAQLPTYMQWKNGVVALTTTSYIYTIKDDFISWTEDTIVYYVVYGKYCSRRTSAVGIIVHWTTPQHVITFSGKGQPNVTTCRRMRGWGSWMNAGYVYWAFDHCRECYYTWLLGAAVEWSDVHQPCVVLRQVKASIWFVRRLLSLVNPASNHGDCVTHATVIDTNTYDLPWLSLALRIFLIWTWSL